MADLESPRETALAFLERRVEQLNEVMVAQQHDIAVLNQKIEQLQAQLRNMREDAVERRPPHY
ncbi:MAG: SlyX family protein [Victivallales bacterium]|nr:SlyX family protein [Victivallales bacterium]